MPYQSWLKPRRRIYLVRHAAVSYVDAQGFLADHETVSLTPEGRQQAETLTRELIDIPFDRVLSSDLPRCLETTGLLVAGRSLAIESHAALREIRPGNPAELPRQSLEQLFSQAFGKQVTLESRFLLGEALGAFLDRVLSCFSALLAVGNWQHLLIVAHGGVNRALIAHALGMGVNSFGMFEQDPCCLNLIDVDDHGGYLVRLLNHTAYNPVHAGVFRTMMEQLYLDVQPRRLAGS